MYDIYNTRSSGGFLLAWKTIVVHFDHVSLNMESQPFCLCRINAVGKEWIGKSGHWEERTRRDKDKISRTLNWVIFRGVFFKLFQVRFGWLTDAKCMSFWLAKLKRLKTKCWKRTKNLLKLLSVSLSHWGETEKQPSELCCKKTNRPCTGAWQKKALKKNRKTKVRDWLAFMTIFFRNHVIDGNIFSLPNAKDKRGSVY